MKSGSSACIGSHGHSVVTILAASWYQKSRDGFISTAAPVRLTTTTQSTPPLLAIAASTLLLSGTFFPPRKPSSAVMKTFDWQSVMGLGGVSGGKAAHTTEGGAPNPPQGGNGEGPPRK